MRLLGAKPERCHSMDTTLTRTRVVALHTYTCKCGREHDLGAKHHNQVRRFDQAGLAHGIRWKACAQPVEGCRYVGISKKTQEILAARQEAKR